jgi:hypothetical protein
MTRTFKRIPTFLLILLFIAPGIVQGEDTNREKTSTRTKAILDDLQRGQWLNKKFVTTLQKTKSPRLAGLNIRQSGFRVLKEDDQYPVQVIWNFHEAGIGFTIVGAKYVKHNDSYELRTSPQSEYSSEQENDVVYYPATDEISWKFTDHGKRFELSFVRVQHDIDRYINKKVLAGEYVDSTGRIFNFSENGIATWPDKTIEYKICVDYIPRIDEITCDCFSNTVIENHKVKSHTTWDFSIDKNRLLVYEPFQPDEYCSKKILYTLKRRTKN